METPRIARSETQPTAVIHLTIPREQIREMMGPAIDEVIALVGAQGIGPAGPVYSHHLRTDPKIFDFVVGVPVIRPVEPAGRVERGDIPEATVARTVYRGGYEGLGATWREFDAWVASSGHTPPPRPVGGVPGRPRGSRRPRLLGDRAQPASHHMRSRPEKHSADPLRQR